MINLNQFIHTLFKHQEIISIDAPVDPYLEIAEIHRKVAAAKGPALLFNNVKGSKFRVATNLFGSEKRLALAFPSHPHEILARLIDLVKNPEALNLTTLWKERKLFKRGLHIGTRKTSSGPIMQSSLSSLEEIPFLTSWPLDGGPFLTQPLVYTQDPETAIPNLGMYRIQRFSANRCGLHFQIGKGAGYHYLKAQSKKQSLPVNIFLGGPPALLLSAITPLPENLSELLLCSFLQEQKLKLCLSPSHPLPLINECEFAICGESPTDELKPEGPFGDHYGYYSLKHPFPYLKVKQIYCKKNAIYPATVVGKPLQEDYIMGEYLQRLLAPLIHLAMPGVEGLWSYAECGFHALSAARVKERYSREALAHAFRILGEGQLSLTKFLLLTDQKVDLTRIEEVLPCILERFNPQTDLYIFSNLSMDTLDYSGPSLNKGSKGVLVGLGEKKRELLSSFDAKLPPGVRLAKAFCPGCLLIESKDSRLDKSCLQHPSFKDWPLIIQVDSAIQAAASSLNFLWTVFTRFEPAADITASSERIYRHHLCYECPVFIDARMKPSYPNEVIPLKETTQLVEKRWRTYFPKGMVQGSSINADVYALSEEVSLMPPSPIKL